MSKISEPLGNRNVLNETLYGRSSPSQKISCRKILGTITFAESEITGRILEFFFFLLKDGNLCIVVCSDYKEKI